MSNNFKKTSLNSRPIKTVRKSTKTSRRLKTNYYVNGNKKYSRKKVGLSIGKIFFYTILFFIVLGLLIGLILYTKYIKDLPSINELENLDIAQSSVIYDRNGNVLYNVYKEKRTYIEYDKIGKNMINAIIAIEDKRYWENPGFDIMGLFRSFIYGILGKNTGFAGTSTITQQLIRNTIIENRNSTETFFDKIERKVKEIYLSYKLTSGLSKEKILELFLNKIPFGNNAHGIEQASKTYFNKSAIDLNILESSILASIPKGPSYYSPYTHPDRLLGYILTYSTENEENKIEILTQKDVEANLSDVLVLKNYINNLKGSGVGNSDKMVMCGVKKEDFFRSGYSVDSDGCLIIKYQDLINFLNDIRLTNDGKYIEYWTGRKDIVLGRMLEDGYINFNEYKEAIINSIGYTFNQARENIQAPHFVFFVKEYLEEKYGKENISVGGFKIYTTLDSKLQAKAQELIEKQVDSNTTRFNATNAALISLDNKNGDILAMVGGVDYFDQENKGNVNIVTSPLQPGSSFKPFVYSIGIYNQQIGSKTPIYDLETKFPGNYTPKNFEGGFLGKMNISTALGHSRNIPAVKMFYMAGGESNIVSFMKKLGVQSLKDHGQYGAPLALGTGEMTPLEMATAYSVFANLGEKVEINPILKIVDSKGNIIEEKREPKKEKVISEAQTYIINSILSDTSTRPPSRNNYISLGGTRPVAAKTGTSTKQFEKNGRKDIYPANLWTIGYTPQITTIVWAGNVDGSQVGMSGDGLNGAGPIWRDFMSYAHEGKEIETWKKPASVYEINISEISGLLPNPENSGTNLLEKSLFVNKPTEYDQSYQTIQIDALCGGKVTENTPSAAIRTATLVEFHSLNPNNSSWEEPVQEWARLEAAMEKYGNVSNLVTSVSNKICERGTKMGNVTIGSNIKNEGNYSIGENYLELGYKSDNPIKSIEILVNGNINQTVDTGGKKEGIYYGSLNIPGMYKNQKLIIEIRAVDDEYYSTSEVKQIFVGSRDETAPIISLINPIDNSIKLYDTDYFNLRANIEDSSKIEVIVYINGIEYKNLGNMRKLELPINEEKNLIAGIYEIKIEAKDIQGNTSESIINLEIMKK